MSWHASGHGMNGEVHRDVVFAQHGHNLGQLLLTPGHCQTIAWEKPQTASSSSTSKPIPTESLKLKQNSPNQYAQLNPTNLQPQETWHNDHLLGPKEHPNEAHGRNFAHILSSLPTAGTRTAGVSTKTTQQHVAFGASLRDTTRYCWKMSYRTCDCYDASAISDGIF